VTTLQVGEAPPTLAISELGRRWGIYTPGELKQRCKELDRGSFLIEGLIPQRSLSAIVGDSGLGKSPLLYQAGICVAGGIPFLGRRVSQGRVLYLDFENGLGDVDELVGRLSRHLGLLKVPDDLLLWNFNDAPPTWKRADLAQMIRDTGPAWVIVDSLGAFAPEIEEKSGNVTGIYQDFRKSVRECGSSITGVLHIRKPSNQAAPPPLEEDPHGWFLEARGARALINGMDARIGVDRFRSHVLEGLDGRSAEIALVIAGFARIRGRVAPTFLARVLGEDDEPLGYVKLAGTKLLFNTAQETSYGGLPELFKFKDAQKHYGKGAQATTDFLRKCLGVGILQRDGREYRKRSTASPEHARVERSKRPIHSAALRLTPLYGGVWTYCYKRTYPPTPATPPHSSGRLH
jgi:hypothetical protein